MHETSESRNITDPYAWVKNMNEKEEFAFKKSEEEFLQLSLFKNDALHKLLLRE